MADIILTDTPGTFADESYGDNPKDDPVMVLGEFKGNVDLTWHAALLSQLRRSEVKWKDFRRKKDSLPTDLAKSVLLGMRKALIAITDDREYRAAVNESIGLALKKDVSTLPPEEQARIVEFGRPFVDRMVLIHSPLWEVNTFLGEDDLRDEFDDVVKKLGNSRNVRFLATRSVSAFFEAIGPYDVSMAERWIVDLEQRRMRAAIEPVRTFDQGNEKVTNVIRSIRREVAARVYGDLGVDIKPAKILEADSKQSRHVGAGDLAAGYARDLYLSSDGLSRVRDAFDLVVLNGEVLRR